MSCRLHSAIAVAAALAACSGLAVAQDQGQPEATHEEGVKATGHQRVYHERTIADPSSPAGKITFDTTVHDFGHIVDTDPVTCEFKFRNTGEADLVINAVNSTCGCTIPELTKTIYKPGEEGVISVTFNPSGKRGDQSKRISVQSNDKDQPASVLQITTYIEQLVSFEPPFLSFGNLRKGEVQSRTVSVIGRSPDLDISDLSIVGNPGLTAEVIESAPYTLADGSTGRKIDIEVTTDGTVKPGPLQGNLSARTNDQRRPEINASITGAVIGDVVLDVDRLPIGILAPGKTFERVVHIENRLGKPFTFKGAELKAPIGENQVNWEVLPPEDASASGDVRTAYDLKLTITAGPRNGALRGVVLLKTDVPDEETLEVSFWGTVREKK